jgi:hypothetical protein
MAIDIKQLMEDVKSASVDILNAGNDQAIEMEAGQRRKIGAALQAIAKDAARMPTGSGLTPDMRTLMGLGNGEVMPTAFVPGLKEKDL